MNKRRGPGEAILRQPGPGEGFDPTESDVEGHAIGDTQRRPIEGLVGQPTTGHDGLVQSPQTGGEDIPDFGPED